MKTRFAEALQQLPGPATDQYPEGAPSAILLRHGSMQLRLFTPGSNTDGRDRQVPHEQDELYIVHRGTARFRVGNGDGDSEPVEATPGDVLFVAAGERHLFTDFSTDFATWVVFYGPPGGEK